MSTTTFQNNSFTNSIQPIVERSWYELGKNFVNAIKHALYNLDVVYQSPIPAGAKLLCSNHPSTIDPVLMTTLVPDQVRILISETLFKVPVLGKSLAAGGHIPVLHDNGSQALVDGIRCLQAGSTVGIFPEGAISPAEGGLAHVHTGAARLALSSRVPVIPIGVALDKGKIWYRKTVVDGKVEVGTWYLHGAYAITVGSPMFFHGDANDRAYVRNVTAQIAAKILELSNESALRLENQRTKKNARHERLNEFRLPRWVQPTTMEFRSKRGAGEVPYP